MNILIPMAGEGKRFSDAGYKLIKPAIPTIDWRTGCELPMVLCATKDLGFIEEDGNNLIYVIRNTCEYEFIKKKIEYTYNKARFINAIEITEGQACTCLLAKELINTAEELLIGTCDNGMLYDEKKLVAEMKTCDAISFTYRHNEAVLQNPDAYGWIVVDDNNLVIETSIKKAISNNPMNDHAITGAFWFKRGSDFVKSAESMINAGDRVNGEFYVDVTLKYLLRMGLKIKAFEIDHYLGWGAPKDYERYQDTYKYWYEFAKGESLI